MKPEDQWSRLNSGPAGNMAQKFRASIPLFVVIAILVGFGLLLDIGHYFSTNAPSRNMATVKTDQHLLIWILTRLLPFLLGISALVYIVLRKRKR